jgi:hypothetical protein
MRTCSYDFQSLREQFDTTTAAGENPTNGQQVDPRFVMVMDIPIWQSLCAQLFRAGSGQLASACADGRGQMG